MFEIRIICDTVDTDRVTSALSNAFVAGAVRTYPTRDSKRTRLYVTADHRPQPEPWPEPGEVYALAPSIVSEIGWIAKTAACKPFGEVLMREYWLRKAAALDRIAVGDEAEGITGDAGEVATEAARQLIAHDFGSEGGCHGAPYRPDDPDATANPRGYVRQEYAQWAKNQ
ncbi:hypothetical protein [Streptomyces mangrovisoli]|uniref:Uncharacterized protein n=1 Tax=Streptomyces mangrovisoli TaxID=1428628 RepID=A0A1J4P4H9_9ACTN|nr:hypothetical protein [Streptomyces mangrovisoli]OIJ69673.1 hypothetical protein WN71_002020 [Streptomyces mangrovisoli]